MWEWDSKNKKNKIQQRKHISKISKLSSYFTKANDGVKETNGKLTGADGADKNTASLSSPLILA